MFYFTLMLCSTLLFNFQCPFVLPRCFAFASLSRDSLAILSHTFTFVNPFFKLFLIFFDKIRNPLRRKGFRQKVFFKRFQTVEKNDYL